MKRGIKKWISDNMSEEAIPNLLQQLEDLDPYQCKFVSVVLGLQDENFGEKEKRKEIICSTYTYS